MTYQEAMEYLDAFVNYEQRRDPKAMREVKLERMRRLCQRLGDPQRRFRSIVVTGTNGKGSVCAMLYAMLRESDLRAGLYTSPHLEHVRERICVSTSASERLASSRTPEAPALLDRTHGTDWIPESEFAAIITQLKPVLEHMRREVPEQPPTYFEVLTAMAFVYFNQRQVDVAILEVGMGGRLDATNVVEQAVSVITPVDLDHTEILGTTQEEIAVEKAGIIKPRQSVISAAQLDGVLRILREACETQGAPLYVFGEDFTARIHHHDLEGSQVSITGLRGIYESLTIPLIGRHQAQNAALAIAAFEALSDFGIPYQLVERGLTQVEWLGRLELVHDTPLVFMDGAHNPQAASVLADTLKELCPGRKIHLLVGVSSDKSVEDIGQHLGPLVISATCTKSRQPRALEPTMLAKRLAPFCADVHVMSEAADAYTYLLNAVSPQDVIVVTGSLFLVGELRAAIRRPQMKPRRPIAVAAAEGKGAAVAA